MFTFRDTGKEFELKGDLLKMITNKKYNVDLPSLSDKKLIYDFAKEMNFDVKAQSKKSTRDRTLLKLTKSPGLLISASGIWKTIFLPPDPNEICNRLKLLIEEKQAEKNSDIIDEELIAKVDKLLEYECLPKKQHKPIFLM